MAIIFALLLFIPIFYLLYIPVNAGNISVKVSIKSGESLNSIAITLKDHGLIRNAFVFKAYVRLTGQAPDLKAGNYNFSGRLDSTDVAFILVNGLSESEDIRFLVSEGFNIWEVDKRMANLGLIKEGEFSSVYYKNEGYLFPDTYRLNQLIATNSYDISDKLHQRMEDNFAEKTADVFKDLSNEEKIKIVIIASILEKEARVEQDMKLVAGIIYKRLELDMSLQIDAIVTYGACYRQFDSQIRDPGSRIQNCDVTFQGVAREIKIDSPYNSYIRKGLPPTPISNPGLRSMEAALNPTKSNYLYYLSTRDGSQMIFSKTGSEHAGNRRKYLGI